MLLEGTIVWKGHWAAARASCAQLIKDAKAAEVRVCMGGGWIESSKIGKWVERKELVEQCLAGYNAQGGMARWKSWMVGL